MQLKIFNDFDYRRKIRLLLSMQIEVVGISLALSHTQIIPVNIKRKIVFSYEIISTDCQWVKNFLYHHL